MNALLTPARRRGVEILDDRSVDPEVMTRSMMDVERANSLLGGRRAAIAELRPILSSLSGTVSMLDVGTGRGDIPAAAKLEAEKLGLDLRTFGIDISPPLAAARGTGNDATVQGDALRLPFAAECVDVVLASQILHHFAGDTAVAFIREMCRVARRAVVISDLRRSVIAAAGLWIGSFPLRFHPVSRHDGVVSVMRGFLPAELADIMESATGKRPVVRRRLGFRLTAAWTRD